MSDKPIQRITSLVEFQPEEIDVHIEYPDHIEIVPMRTLSYLEIMQIHASVVDPKPVAMGIDPVTKRPLFDLNDPGYQQKVSEAYSERIFKQLVAALCVEIPGDTDAEKVAYLKNLSNARIQGLAAALNKIMEIGQAQLLARAETFQPGRPEGTTHLSANGLVAAAVEQVSAG